MTIEQIRKALLGEWVSIAPEIRPSALKNENGSAKPFYLTRDFKYAKNEIFELTIVNSADPYGKIPLAKIFIRGHISLLGDHPIAEGARKVDFIADEAYQVTPLITGFADLLNQVAGNGYDQWAVGKTQSIFEKSFAPFGLMEGVHFKEFDLVYLFNDMLFGAPETSTGVVLIKKKTGRPTFKFR